ncbi:MAG: response regulator [Candidatus Didemnitutus sp.]|nr:response regulator [Candidatus Didemnitutus sp.]
MPAVILVVDDAKPVRELAKRALAPFDVLVTEASNGFNALFAMEKAMPNIILLDVSMPIMDGVELLTLMRSKPELQRIPVVMLTSPADHRIRPTLDELGIAAALIKPIQPADLLAAIQQVLPLQRAKPSAGPAA